MARAATTMETLKHVGGHPALDFVNTVHHWAGTGPQREYLLDYSDLLHWARSVSVLDAREARALAHACSVRPEAGARVYREALALRSAIHEVMQASIAGRAAGPRQVHVFDRWYRRAVRARGVSIDHDGKFSVGWDFAGQELPLELPLLKLTRLASEFMLTVEPGRLKECPAEPGCGWLFHDTSRNRSRRWCDMSDCGNTAKARRHYARVRSVRGLKPT